MFEENIDSGGFINDSFYLVGAYVGFNFNYTHNSIGRYYNKVALL